MHANEMSPWDQYEFAQRRNKGVKLNGKVTDNLEIGSCYNFQSMNFPNKFVHNRKGQVFIDEGDLKSEDFKRDTTWKITEGNFAQAKGAISIGSVPEDDKGEPTVCASENGQCKCQGDIFYGADKGGTLDMARGWTKKHADKSGTTACSNRIFGDPLPGTVKKCFCASSAKAPAEEETAPFNFEIDNQNTLYKIN